MPSTGRDPHTCLRYHRCQHVVAQRCRACRRPLCDVSIDEQLVAQYEMAQDAIDDRLRAVLATRKIVVQQLKSKDDDDDDRESRLVPASILASPCRERGLHLV